MLERNWFLKHGIAYATSEKELVDKLTTQMDQRCLFLVTSQMSLNCPFIKQLQALQSKSRQVLFFFFEENELSYYLFLIMSFLISLCLVGIQEKIVLHEKPFHDNRSVSFWVCSLPNFKPTLQIFFKFFHQHCQYIKFLSLLSYIMIWLFDLLVQSSTNINTPQIQ